MSKGKTTEIQPEEVAPAIAAAEEPNEQPTAKIVYEGIYPEVIVAGYHFVRAKKGAAAKPVEVPREIATSLVKGPKGFRLAR